MNELLKLHWCNEILGRFSFSRQLLALGSFKAHLTDNVRKSLKLSETGTVIVRGGCTKFIQAPDLVWKKPFKGRIQELYDEWPASRKHEFNAAVNIKPVPRRLVVEWVLISWAEVSNETIANSMKSCFFTLAIDCSDDGLISCLKKGKKCESRKAMLENQLKNF